MLTREIDKRIKEIMLTTDRQTDRQTGYPSIDQPWLQYYSKEALETYPEKCTIFRNIYDRNKEFRNNTALNYYGKYITYGQIFDNVEKVAKSLKEYGVKTGNCVALCTSGCPEAIYVVLACSKIGAIANFINPLFTTEQMRDRINDTETDFLFVMDEMIHFVQPILNEICAKHVVVMPISRSMKQPARMIVKLNQAKKKDRYHIGDKKVLWNEFINIGKDYTGTTEENYEKDRPVIMVYSSGTTGASKGIVLTNDGINATIANYLSPDFPYERGITFLQMIPVWFSTGIVLSVIMPICLGVVVIPELAFSKENFVKDLIKYKPNMTLTATSLWLYAIQDKKLDKIDMSNMLYPITGGEAVRPQDEENINAFLMEHGCTAPLIKGYGMCELGSTVMTTNVTYTKKEAAGFPILHVIVAAFDMTTNKELKYGERGEIRVLSPARMKEYFKNEEATNQYFYIDDNGQKWGCTGDIGYVDEDGFAYVCGRAVDNFTKENGSTAYLFDSETVMLRDKAVSQCKTVVIDIDGKQHLCSHIVLNAENREENEIVIRRLYNACIESIPEDEVPRKYKIRESMPVHANGKRNNEALKKEKEGYIEI